MMKIRVYVKRRRSQRKDVVSFVAGGAARSRKWIGSRSRELLHVIRRMKNKRRMSPACCFITYYTSGPIRAEAGGTRSGLTRYATDLRIFTPKVYNFTCFMRFKIFNYLYANNSSEMVINFISAKTLRLEFDNVVIKFKYP